MDNFDLKKYLAEGRLFEQEYPELISFLNANIEDIKQHMRDEFLDVEDEIEYNATINKEIDQVKSFQDMGKYDDIVGAVVSQGEGDVGITYMFKDDYDDEEIVGFINSASTWTDADDVANYFDEPASDIGKLIASYYQEESGYEGFDDKWDNYLDYLFPQTERGGDDIDDYAIEDEFDRL